MTQEEKQELIGKKEQEIINLECDLDSSRSPIGDWKYVKQREAIDQGLEAPYSDEVMKEYFTARSNTRKRINELQKEIEELSE